MKKPSTKKVKRVKFTNNGEPHVCYTFQLFIGSNKQVSICPYCLLAVDSPLNHN